MTPPGEALRIRGLPERLPEGERLLWQGAPQWRAMALRVFHVRKVAIYFGLLILYRFAAALHDGVSLGDTARPTLILLGAGLAACAVLAGIAWLVARTTVYSITSRRVVLHIGVALPITFNLPFAVLAGASVKLNRDGTGTIPLVLTEGNRLAYAVLWPHVRPWHNGKTQPSLRLIPDAARVARMLSEAVAAALPDRVQTLPVTVPSAPAAARPMTPATVAP